MDSIWLYITLGCALIISSLYFWCTYRHIREPPDGRHDNGNVIESRRLSMEIIKEMYKEEE